MLTSSGRPQRVHPDGAARHRAAHVRAPGAADQRALRLAGFYLLGRCGHVRAAQARRGRQKLPQHRQEGHALQRRHAQDEG